MLMMMMITNVAGEVCRRVRQKGSGIAGMGKQTKK
jgi:hypothetical protein